jgi:hypothetical protein
VSLLQAKIGEVAAVLLVAGALGITVSPALAAPGPDAAPQISHVGSGPAPDPAPRTDSTPARSAPSRPSDSSVADAGPVASGSSRDVNSTSSAADNSRSSSGDNSKSSSGDNSSGSSGDNSASSSQVNPSSTNPSSTNPSSTNASSTNTGSSTSSAIVHPTSSSIEAASTDHSPPTNSTVAPASDQPIVTAPVVTHRPARTRTTTRHEKPHARYIMPGILHRRVKLGSVPAEFASLQVTRQPAGADGVLLLVAALAMATVAVSGFSLHQRLRRLGQSGPSGGTVT